MQTPPDKALYIVGLNPSWQKTLRFESFRYGAVNRAVELQESAAGKGANTARAVQAVGGSCLLFQFTGGVTGKLLRDALDRERIAHVSTDTGGRTRVCTTILNDEDGSMTELIEPAAPVPAHAAQSLLTSFLERLPGACGAALCGTYPPGLPDDYPAAFARAAAERGIPVVLDGVRGVSPVLEAGVHVLKVNGDEIRTLTGESAVRTAVRSALSRWPLRAVVVTNGPDPAIVGFPDGDLREIPAPRVNRVRNPLGAGDCVTGVLAWKLCAGIPSMGTREWSEVDRKGFLGCVREALACAAASCLTLTPAVFDPEIARRLLLPPSA